ncbi:MAG: hypothetical protein QM519_06845 [Bacteroidia bacterium]|nr:hypothetical protein [Bacteroidia bacterium]
MTKYTTRVRTVPCHKGGKGYQAEIEFRYRGERYSFEGTLYERRWAAENDAQRMADRIDAYVSIIRDQELAA